MTGTAGSDTNASETSGLAVAAPRFAVFVVTNGRAVQTPVVLGARNDNAAWIDGGLNTGITTGQQVIAYPPATVRDGLRVAARKP